MGAGRAKAARIALAFATLALWAGGARAAPLLVHDVGVVARSAPADDAPVVAELPFATVVCPDPDAGGGGPQWIPIRYRGSVIYVPATALEVASETFAAGSCGTPAVARPASGPGESFGPTHRRMVQGSLDRRFLPLDPFRITVGMAFGAAFLRPSVSDQDHIGSGGPSIHLTFGLVFAEIVSVSSSFGGVLTRDHAAFQQDVVPLLGGGDPMTATSGVQLTTYSIAAGLRTPLLIIARHSKDPWVAALFADYGWSQISAKRSIENCNDCRTEDLEVPDGSFFRVGADVGQVTLNRWDIAYILNLSYQRYVPPAGITDEIRLALMIWFL